jgi:hypothetical protein
MAIKKILAIVFTALLLPFLAHAADFNPRGDINGYGLYNINGIVNTTTTNLWASGDAVLNGTLTQDGNVILTTNSILINLLWQGSAIADLYLANASVWHAKAGTGACSAGYVVMNTTTAGVQCVLDKDTTYTATNPYLVLSGTAFSWNETKGNATYVNEGQTDSITSGMVAFNYANGITAGTCIQVSGTAGEAWSPNVSTNNTCLDASFVGQSEYANLDTDSTNDLTTGTTFGGDVSGTYNAIIVADNSHALHWDNVTSKPANLDTDSTNDLTTATAWGGDLGGTGSSPSVTDNSHNHGNSTITDLDYVKLQTYPSACGAGTAITMLGDTPTCTAFLQSETGDISAVNIDTSGYLTGGAASGSATIGFNETKLNATIDARDDSPTYANSTGLGLSTFTFSILTTYQLPQGCSDGYVAKWNTTSLSWYCAVDSTGAGGGMTSWLLSANGAATIDVTDGETVDFASGSGLNVSRSTQTITFSHNDTSTQSSVDSSNGNVVQDVSLDTYGHVTSLTSYDLDNRYFTETESDTNFVSRGTWTDHDNYAPDCSAGNYVYGLGDTLSCSIPPGANNGHTHDSANITSGTIVNARYNTSYLLTTSGFDAANLTSGTVPDARISTTIARSGTFQCGGTDQLYNLTVNSTGVYGLCSAQGSAGGSNSFVTWDAPSGTDPVADTTSDTMILTASGIVSITGDESADSLTIGAVEVDGSTTNELQNLWATMSSDSGSVAANSQTDTFTIAGGTDGLDTSITGDTVTFAVDPSEFATDDVPESKMDFDTTCGSTSKLYVSGNDLACNPDDTASWTNTTTTVTTTLDVNITGHKLYLGNGGCLYQNATHWRMMGTCS